MTLSLAEAYRWVIAGVENEMLQRSNWTLQQSLRIAELRGAVCNGDGIEQYEQGNGLLMTNGPHEIMHESWKKETDGK
jgi:hypothetical protein